MKLLIRWLITSLSLFVAEWIVPGITVDGNAWTVFIGVAVIFGLLNALVRPLLTLLSCPLILLTLGLFIFVINALMLMLTSWIATNLFGVGFFVEGFWSALFGSIIISIVSTILSMFLHDATDDSEPEGYRPPPRRIN